MALRRSSGLNRRLEALTRVTRRSDIGRRYQLATVLGPQVLTPQDWNELTLWQRTVLSWPRVIYDTDEWSVLAMETQERLVRDTGEWLGPPVVDDSKDPAIRFRGAITTEA